MSSNWMLGSFEFDDLQGEMILPASQRDIESKIGVDGVVVFATGRRASSFELQSMFAFSSWALANAGELAYQDGFSATPVNIVRGGYTFAGSGIQFVVLGCRTRIESIPFFQSAARGTVSPAHIVHATWRLQAVEVEV